MNIILKTFCLHWRHSNNCTFMKLIGTFVEITEGDHAYCKAHVSKINILCNTV